MGGVNTGKYESYVEAHAAAVRALGKKRMFIWTPEALEELGKELLEHVDQPGVWYLSSFARKKDRTVEWLLELSKKYPTFREYYLQAKQTLGEKIIAHTFAGGKSNSFIVETLTPMYLKEIDLYQSQKMKKKARIEMEMKKMLETKQDGGSELVDALRKYLELSQQISDHAAKKAQDAAE